MIDVLDIFFIEDSAERADVAENQLGKLRAKTRSTSSANRTSPAVSFYLPGNEKIPLFCSVIYANRRVIHEEVPSSVLDQFANVKLGRYDNSKR